MSNKSGLAHLCFLIWILVKNHVKIEEYPSIFSFLSTSFFFFWCLVLSPLLTCVWVAHQTNSNFRQKGWTHEKGGRCLSNLTWFFFFFFKPFAMAIKSEGLKPTSTFSHSSFTFLFLFFFFFFFGFFFVQHTFIVIWTLTTSFATTFLEWHLFSLSDLVFPW